MIGEGLGYSLTRLIKSGNDNMITRSLISCFVLKQSSVRIRSCILRSSSVTPDPAPTLSQEVSIPLYPYHHLEIMVLAR